MITAPPAADPAVAARTSSTASHLTVVLVVAFLLSAANTAITIVQGTVDPLFAVTSPAPWLFYALGFSSAVWGRSRRRGVQALLVGYLVLLDLIAVVVYPATFTPAQQTPTGWFENDVYTALIILATYLAVLRVRRVRLA
jgi:peptidoglycan/LPS O-acetylase OafA/YrhL